MVSQSMASDYKAPGGKLIRVRLNAEDGAIKTVRIYGDFFLVPEESLVQLERSLEGSKLDRSEVRGRVQVFFETSGAHGLGVSTDDIVEALLSTREGEGSA